MSTQEELHVTVDTAAPEAAPLVDLDAEREATKFVDPLSRSGTAYGEPTIAAPLAGDTLTDAADTALAPPAIIPEVDPGRRRGRGKAPIALGVIAALATAGSAALFKFRGGDSDQPSVANREPVAGALPYGSDSEGVVEANLSNQNAQVNPYLKDLPKQIAAWEEQAGTVNFFEGGGSSPEAFMQEVLNDWKNKLAAAPNGNQSGSSLASEIETVTGLRFLVEDMSKTKGGVTEIDIAAVYGMWTDKETRHYTPNASGQLKNGARFTHFVGVYQADNGWQAFMLGPERAGWFTSNMESTRLIGVFADESKGNPKIIRAQISGASLTDEEPGIKVLPTSGLHSFHRIKPARVYNSVQEAAQAVLSAPGAADSVKPMKLSDVTRSFAPQD